MIKHFIVQVFCALITCSLAFAQTSDPYQRGVVHVKLKPAYAAKVSQASTGKFGIAEVDQLNSQLGVQSMKRVFRDAGNFEKAHQQFGLHLWYEVRFDERKSVSDVIKQYQTLDHFQSVEPCLKYELVKPTASQIITPPTQQSSFTTPTNDPLFSQQWHYHNTGQTGGTPGADISLPEAWSIQSGSTNVIVAVIDGGIDISHPELGGAMWVNTDEIPANGIDDDHNGYIDDVNGYGFGDNTGTIYPHFHASHVGGTIGAITNNSIGVSGIAGGSGTANGVRLMSCAGFGQFSTGGFEDAMVYAADNGAVISQNSWGGGSSAIEAAIDYFVARAGLDNSDANFSHNIQIGPMAGGIVIFAAGNSNTDNPSIGYPASYSPVMAVAATDHNDVRASFSNYGSWVDIAAPGLQVFSSYPVSLGSYAYLSGTSMACPHVSGVAALIISQFGGASYRPELVWDRLQHGADDISALNPGYEGKLGAGRLNAFQALQTPDSIPPADITDLAVQQPKLTSVILTWTAPGASGMDGTASAYEIRYSTSPITPANFSAATLVTSLPRPQVSGSIENFEIKNLANSTLYYFAMTARDFFGNVSGLSNVVSTSTLLPPVIGVSPTSLTETLFTGGTSTQNITVRNTGASDLIIGVSASSVSTTSVSTTATNKQLKDLPQQTSLKKAGNEYANPLSLKQSSTLIKPNSSPITTTGVGRLFTLDYNAHLITELNPETGERINSFAPPESYSDGSEGLAFDGKYLYFVFGNGSNTIYQLNSSTGEIINRLSTSIPAIDGLGHSGKYLYAMDYANNVIREIDFSAGTVVRTINPGIDIGGGLSFGGSRGTIFVSNFSNNVFEVDLETGHVVHTLTTVGVNYGLGYSEGLGLLLCADVSQSTIDAYDPNTGELKFSYTIPISSAIASDESGNQWLKEGGKEWTIAAGSEALIPVMFDANGLIGGTYHGSVTIDSNDPVTPEVNVPVTLTVTGAPNLSVKSDSIDFGDRYASGTYDTIISIKNNGTDVLNISSIVINNPAFTIGDSTSFSLAPGNTVDLHLRFSPVSLGTYNGTLTITSNDPDQGSFGILVRGRAVAPPVIGIDPKSFEVSLFTGDTTTQNMVIQNTGEANLNFNLQIETEPSTGSIKTVSTTPQKEIISVNNKGEEAKSYIFDNNQIEANGDFSSLASSPAFLTCFTADPHTGIIYAQQNQGYSFYKYEPASNTWTSLASCPLNSLNNGGAAYLNGKIYTSYTQNINQLGVYTIATNTWSTITLSVSVSTGNIESDGTYIYFVAGSTLVRYNPGNGATTTLASPPFFFESWGGLSYLNGVLYGHQGNGYAGFAKYDIASNTWTTLPSVPGGAVLGSAIDPTKKVYYAYGSYSGNNWYAYDITSEAWSVNPLPLFYVGDGGLAYVPTAGKSGIYFTQGENGYGLGRFETSSLSEWLSASPLSGTIAENNNETIAVKFDAAHLFGGTYTGSLVVTSNDPVQAQIKIPVTLHVTGAPNISIEKDSVDFGVLFTNTIKKDSILIENTGTDDLIISSITTLTPFAVAFGGPLTLKPGESSQVNVTFNPTSVGTFNGSLTITSNDPGQGSLEVLVKGGAVAPPVIGIDPKSFEASLFTDETSTQNMMIQNTGEADLTYNLQIETTPSTGSIKTASYTPTQEIITTNNSGEKIKSMAFDETKIEAAGDFTSLTPSPALLTCFTADPHTGIIYAQENQGYSFYKYVPASDTWTSLASCPLNSYNNGGATYLNGKIYTAYTQNSSQLGVYDIASNTWNTITLSVSVNTGNIESDGTYVYFVSGYTLVRYNPGSGATTILASAPFYFQPWGGLSYLDGVLYGHQGNGYAAFGKYDIATNTWTSLPSVPGGAVLGSAIDPVKKIYYTYGSYGGNSWYAYDMTSGVWSVTPLSLFYVSDGGLTYVPTGKKGIYFTQGEAGYGLGRFETSSFSDWLSATPTTGTIAKNNNQSVAVKFDAAHLFGGTYTGSLNVTSNDPVQSQITVPVTLHVTGVPDINIERDSVDFGVLFTSQIKMDSVLIENTGTDDLIISSITTSTPFAVAFGGAFTLKPGENRQVGVSFNPTSIGVFNGTLTITSNDPNESSIGVPLTGKTIPAPIVGVNPTSLSASLLTGQTQTKTLTISNTGGSPLNWSLKIGDGGSNSLPDILSNLDNHYSDITSLIPNRYDFMEGESGYYIMDGGNDMYDGGNQLGTNLGSPLAYTQGAINSSALLGSGGSYFTKKYPGLFVMVADMNASYFEITGDLGADGGGNMDATILQSSFAGKNYKGFVKRVYNAGDPSVNHLIIVEDNGSTSHDYSTYTNSDYHRITPLSGTTRVYYLLFAGNGGSYIDNTSMLAIMNAFFTSSNLGLRWLRANKMSGSIAAGQSDAVSMTFDATGMSGGTYTSKITVGSNDPATPQKEIPATLTVTDAPDIDVSKSSLNFGNVYVSGTKQTFFNVRNTGTALLTVNSITSTSGLFIASPTSFSVNPHDSTRVYVQFSPTSVGVQSASLKIASNDADESEVNVNLLGTGITPPALTIAPNVISTTITAGDRKYSKVKIQNTGGDHLDWHLDNSQSPYWSIPDIYSGSVLPGGETEITFTLDTKNIPLSTYTWNVWMYSNDPLHSLVAIPFTVTISLDHAPVASVIIANKKMEVNSHLDINLADYFSDPDQEVLKFTAQSDSTGVASTSLSGSVLTVAAKGLGTTLISVVAQDGIGEIAVQTFRVQVVTVITGIEETDLSTFRNYPNPFDTKTLVTFSLPEESNVSLKLYDGTGREFPLLQNRSMAAGDHQMEVGENLTSGIYLCRLIVNGTDSGTIKLLKK